MSFDDFNRIKFFKMAILLTVCIVLLLHLIASLIVYETYLPYFIILQKIYALKLIYCCFMVSYAAYRAIQILKKSKNQNQNQAKTRKLYHAIVLPIYQQPLSILKSTLSKLSQHSRAKSNYLIFLAMEANSSKPLDRANELILMFNDSFFSIKQTIHELKSGEARGKASNEDWCVRRMEPTFQNKNINNNDVLFTTIDCDNWASEAYFEEVQLFLSRNDWKMNNYMFTPEQMFNININKVPLLNRVMDYFLGCILFVWSNNITKVQNAASNYSISYNKFKQIGFFDTNADSMCDDFHNSMKAIWESKQKFQIIPIFVLFNFMSLDTGEGYWSNIKARFWQAERHMRSILDAAYNLNMVCKKPFNLRGIWTTIAYLENHFFAFVFCVLVVTFVLIKIITNKEFTQEQSNMAIFELCIMGYFILVYYYIAQRTSRVIFKQKTSLSVLRCLQVLILNKIVLLLFVAAQIIAIFRVNLSTPVYNAAKKSVQTEKTQ